MLKRWSFILVGAVVGLVGLWVYLAYRTPPGVEPMGETSETIAWVALATSVVSLLTALIGLAQKFLELRKG
jgi:hypothetical protein